jgi:hypothetical protein
MYQKENDEFIKNIYDDSLAPFKFKETLEKLFIKHAN